MLSYFFFVCFIFIDTHKVIRLYNRDKEKRTSSPVDRAQLITNNINKRKQITNNKPIKIKINERERENVRKRQSFGLQGKKT